MGSLASTVLHFTFNQSISTFIYFQFLDVYVRFYLGKENVSIFFSSKVCKPVTITSLCHR